LAPSRVALLAEVVSRVTDDLGPAVTPVRRFPWAPGRVERDAAVAAPEMSPRNTIPSPVSGALSAIPAVTIIVRITNRELAAREPSSAAEPVRIMANPTNPTTRTRPITPSWSHQSR
jgi:hypothetical protein